MYEIKVMMMTGTVSILIMSALCEYHLLIGCGALWVVHYAYYVYILLHNNMYLVLLIIESGNLMWWFSISCTLSDLRFML